MKSGYKVAVKIVFANGAEAIVGDKDVGAGSATPIGKFIPDIREEFIGESGHVVFADRAVSVIDAPDEDLTSGGSGKRNRCQAQNDCDEVPEREIEPDACFFPLPGQARNSNLTARKRSGRNGTRSPTIVIRLLFAR